MRTCDDPNFIGYTNECMCAPEDHERTVMIYQYAAAIKVASAWVVPEVRQPAVVKVPGLIDALQGSALWHPDYGYFGIVGFDRARQLLTIEFLEGSALPGTAVAPCTSFIVTVPPA